MTPPRQGVWVGREHELGLLDAVASQALEGRGESLLLLGEAGIGKTRLLEELAERARGSGLCVAWGRGWELGNAPSFWPWREILRCLLERPAAPRALAGHLEPLLDSHGHDGRGPAAGPDAFELYEAVQSYLHAHARIEPLALFLDDVHAFDPSSLALAELVARGLPSARIALFSARRESMAAGGSELEPLGYRFARASRALVLPPLSPQHVARWVAQTTGSSDAHLASRVHAASDGNPLFVSELLRLPELEARGELTRLPATLRALIRERLRALRAEHLPVLQAAAIVGRQFTLPMLGLLFEASPAALAAATHEAHAAGVLGLLDPGHYRFSHALVAEVLVLDLEPSERQRLHRRAAEVLERHHAADPAAPVNEMARHWLEAGSEVAVQAVRAAERAARCASGLLAFADAARLYERALAAQELCSPVDVRQRGELLVAATEALARAGRRTQAEARCRQAVELARRLDDPTLLARAALALGAENQLGNADQPLVHLLERALGVLPEGDSELAALLRARLASARQPEPDPVPPMQLAREAIAMARRLGRPATALSVIHAALGALMDFADADERAALNAEALELAARLGDRPRALQAARRLAFDRVELGDVAGFEAALARYESLAAEVEQPRYAWVPAMFRCMRADWHGDRQRARAHEREARAIRERASGDGERLVPARPLALALSYTDTTALERFVDELLTRAPRGSGALWLSALLAAWQGRSTVAHAALDELGARGFAGVIARGAPAASSSEPEHQLGLGYLHMPEVAVELACHLGDVAWASNLYAELEASAGKAFVLTTIGFSLHGVVDHALMRLCAVEQRWDTARRHQQAALELSARLRARPLAARIHLDAARHALAEAELGGPRLELLQSVQEHLGESERLARELDWNELLEQGAVVRAAAEAAGTRAAATLAAVPTPPADESRPAPSATTPDAGPLRLILEGEYWTVSAAGALCRVQDSRGMRMLARLVERPHHKLHVLDLSGSPLGADRSDAGELLDTRAAALYRQRLNELRAELDDAQSSADLGRHERLSQELEALKGELARAFGLGGRARRSASAVERARVNVRRRLTLALSRIRAGSPELGARLEASLHTGVYCVYTPRS